MNYTLLSSKIFNKYKKRNKKGKLSKEVKEK